MTVNIVKTKFIIDVKYFKVNNGTSDEDAEKIKADI
jgi:hypothetical protein